MAVVDDDPSVRSALARLLASHGYPVRTFASATELLEFGPGDFGCVVVDVHLGGMSGFDLGELLRERGVLRPLVFISAQDDEATRARAGHPDQYLRKPFDVGDLLGAISRATGEA